MREVIQDLKHYRMTAAALEERLTRLDQLTALTCRLDAAGVDVSRLPTAARTKELKAAVLKDIEELTAIQEGVQAALNTLDLQERVVLSYMYIDGLTGAAAAAKLCYSESYFYKLLKQALKKLKLDSK